MGGVRREEEKGRRGRRKGDVGGGREGREKGGGKREMRYYHRNVLQRKSDANC